MDDLEQPVRSVRAPRRFNQVLLAVDGITLRFGGVAALVDVGFDIMQGEIRAIIGPNGAGKSSMLNVINGFYQAQEGTITYKGRTRRHMRPHEAARIGNNHIGAQRTRRSYCALAPRARSLLAAPRSRDTLPLWE